MGSAAITGVLAISLVADVTAIKSGNAFGDAAATPLNIEDASQYLMKHGAKDVVYTWDNPTGRIMPPDLTAAVGGFFFKRANDPVNIIPMETAVNVDPNTALLAVAAPSGAAIIWLFDMSVTGTAATRYPPDIEKITPFYVCQKFGLARIGSVACYVK